MVVLVVLVLVVPVAVVVAVARAVRGDRDVDWSTLVRQFFQHLVTAVLAVVAADGLAGLLGRALAGPGLLADARGLAVPVAFTVVGVPLFLVAAWWLLGRLEADAEERESLGWAVHLAAVGTGSLVVVMVAAWRLAEWALDGSGGWAGPVADLVVWGALWLGYRVVDRRVDAPLAIIHVVAGSAVGLVTLAVGSQRLLARLLDAALGRPSVVDTDPRMVLVGIALGAAAWALYWLRDGLARPRDGWWYGWVLLGPVLQGLLVVLGCTGWVLDRALVWLLGDPGAASAAEHFADVPEALAAGVVALVVVLVHRMFLDPRSTRRRTEVDRVHDLLLAAVGLLAAATGFASVVVALLEAITGPGAVARGASPVNTLLGALTLLLLGLPVWWRAWSRCQRLAGRPPSSAEAAAPDPTDPGRAERASTARRVYLVGMFGIGATATLVALLVAVVEVLEDAFGGALGAATVDSARVSIAVVVTAAGVAAIHATAWRADRALGDRGTPRDGARYPSRVTLVGASDDDVVASVRAATSARVELWPRGDGNAPAWDTDQVTRALAGHDAHVVVLASHAGIEVIPVDR